MPNLIALYLPLIRWVLCAAVLVAAYATGCTQANDRHAKREAELEVKHAKALVAAQKVETVEVTKYVEKIVQLPARTVVRDRIVRLCAATDPVRPADPATVGDATAAPDAGDRQLDGLAADLATCQVNKARQAYQAEMLSTIYAANQ